MIISDKFYPFVLFFKNPDVFQLVKTQVEQNWLQA